MKTAQQLTLSFGVLIVLMGGVGLASYAGMERTARNLSRIYEQDLAAIEAADEARLNQAFAARSVRSIFIAADAGEAKKAIAEVKKFASAMDTDLGRLEKLIAGEESRREFDHTRQLKDAWLKRNELIVQYAERNDLTRAMATMRSATAATLDLRASIEKLSKMSRVSAEQSYQDSLKTLGAVGRTNTTMFGIALFMSLALGVWMTRSLARPLRIASEALEQLAGGKLTMRIDTRAQGEVGSMMTSLGNAVDSLRDFLGEVSSTADGLVSAASQLTDATLQLSNGVQTHASAQEQTASMLEELSSTVKQNSSHATRAVELAAESHKKAEAGGSVVASAVEAMAQVSEASRKIADIIGTVDEIAFQTNLLALNAAVEAARAGDSGRGFAVVATEIRNLAGRSASAAREIKGLIEDSVEKIDNASELVNRSGSTLAAVLESGKRASHYTVEIARGSSEQAASIEQAASAMTEMDRATQGNASQTEQLHATTVKLAESATHLGRLVHRFSLQ